MFCAFSLLYTYFFPFFADETVIWLNENTEDFALYGELEEAFFRNHRKLDVSCIVERDLFGHQLAANANVREAAPDFKIGTLAAVSGGRRVEGGGVLLLSDFLFRLIVYLVPKICERGWGRRGSGGEGYSSAFCVPVPCIFYSNHLDTKTDVLQSFAFFVLFDLASLRVPPSPLLVLFHLPLLLRLFPHLAGPEFFTRKVTDYLVRRGYPEEVIITL